MRSNIRDMVRNIIVLFCVGRSFKRIELGGIACTSSQGLDANIGKKCLRENQELAKKALFPFFRVFFRDQWDQKRPHESGKDWPKDCWIRGDAPDEDSLVPRFVGLVSRLCRISLIVYFSLRRVLWCLWWPLIFAFCRNKWQLEGCIHDNRHRYEVLITLWQPRIPPNSGAGDMPRNMYPSPMGYLV